MDSSISYLCRLLNALAKSSLTITLSGGIGNGTQSEWLPPPNSYSKLVKAELGCLACRVVIVGTFGSQSLQSHAYGNRLNAP